MKRRSAETLELDGPPPVTLGLRRFVLRSVGPPAARFHPLDLDLVSAEGTLARRALCVLTNTGGKSTLLKLLSAVVNPGTAGLIGKGEMADMVLATDTSHAVLEGQQADGARYVTGWMAQWPNLQKARPRDLRQCWYTFRVVEGFGVDDLPFEHEGRRTRWEEFRRQLRALIDAHKADAVGTIADTQIDWNRALIERTRIDAELFRYQSTMNAAESGAAALVNRLKTPEAVASFFVSAFDDDVLSATVFREIAAYTAQAARRTVMETHAELCAELAMALEVFHNENMNYASAREMEILDTERRRELAGAVRSRAVVEAARSAEAEQALVAEEERLAATNRSITSDEDRRKQYLLVEAEMRHASAVVASKAAERAERVADLERSAWAAVHAVIAHDSAVAANLQAQEAFDAAEEELAPLRNQVAVAAQVLAAGLIAQADHAAELAVAASARLDAANAARTAAVGRRETALKEEASFQSKVAAGDAAIARTAEQVTNARRRGDIGAGETASEASGRWFVAQGEAAERRRKAMADKDRAAGAHREALKDRSAADLARRDAATAAKEAAAALNSATASARALLDDADVAAVLGETPAGLPPHRAVPQTVAAQAALSIDGQAREVERSADGTVAEVDRVQAELARLRGTDLLDAGADVSRAVEVLREAHISAVTGWTWLEGAVAAGDRLDFIDARPDIANGVVVTDPSRLDAAREALEKAELLPRLAVVVTTSRTATTTVDSLPAGDPDRIVVDPHPGLYDKGKAKAEIARLEDQQNMLAGRLVDQRARSRELRAAVALARSHSQEWPDARLDDAEKRRDEAAVAIAAAESREEAAGRAILLAVAAEEGATLAEQAATAAHDEAAKVQIRLAGLVEAEAGVAAWLGSRPSVVEGIARQGREAQLAATAIVDATAAGELAAGEQREAQQVVRTSRERATQLAVVPADFVPELSVHLLEARFAELNTRLADEAAGRDHLAALRRAEADVSVTAAALTGLSEAVLALATEHSSSVMAATANSVRGQTASTEATWREAVRHSAECRQQVDKWQQIAAGHRPTDRRLVHATLGPEEIPVDADDAARRVAEADSRLVVSRALAASQAAAREAALRLRDTARQAASDFTRLVFEQDAPVAVADPYEGNVDGALAELNQRRKAVTAAKELVAESKLARQAATAAVNRAASGRGWADIGDSIRERCTVATAEVLAEHGGRYLDGLRIREASLRSDIDKLDTHRAVVINSLGQTCDRLRRSLRQVRSASTIPTRVTNVGGQPAIIIEFKPLGVDGSNAALELVVDRWAASGADLSDSRTRLARLMEALSATVENRPLVGHWNVKLLKPRIDGDVTYCTPDRVAKEYSGGQELTLAVMLYCALAKVRSSDRTGSDRPPGLLLLDNPFGAASNERLIEMWQKLAEASDVQLLCFTALSEPSILNAFNGPGTVRQTMRNDREQRNGHQHVRAIGADGTVAGRVATHLKGPELEDGEESRVSGLTYQTKTPFPVEAPAKADQEADPEPDL
jgi:hypothetical protein